MEVFAALVQQLELDDCVIAIAGNDGTPRPWLAGVLNRVKDGHEVYLFDCRLGLPVPGPKGSGIATLAQLKSDPKLLDAFKVPDDACKYDVDAEQLKNTEILVMAPLPALSARMRFLEEDV